MIKEVLKQCKKQLWLTYSLLVIEFAATSTIPWLLGKAIDSLIDQNYEIFFYYVGCSFVGLFVGILRRRIDTRVFMGIWKDLVVQTTKELFTKNILLSKVSARTDNIQRFTDFFEYHIPHIIKAIIYIIISLVFLSNNLGNALLIILFIMACSLTTSCYLSYRIEKIVRSLQEEKEHKELYTLEKNETELEITVNNINTLAIKKSDLEATSWGIVDICCIFCEIVAILVLCNSTSSTGQVASSLMYVNSLCGHFSSFSYYFSHFKELKIAKEFIEKRT